MSETKSPPPGDRSEAQSNEPFHPWLKAEAEVASYMSQAISRGLAVSIEVERAAFRVLSSVSELRQGHEIFHAHAALLTRALQDLRACGILALRGYTMQAWAVAASGFEAAHTIGFIGEDVARAQTWHAHKDLQKVPWDVFSLVDHSYRYLGLGGAEASAVATPRTEYGLYQQLCVGKHVNPVAERLRYIMQDDSRLVISPMYSAGKSYEAQRALALVCRASVMGLCAYSDEVAHPFQRKWPGHSE